MTSGMDIHNARAAPRPAYKGPKRTSLRSFFLPPFSGSLGVAVVLRGCNFQLHQWRFAAVGRRDSFSLSCSALSFSTFSVKSAREFSTEGLDEEPGEVGLNEDAREGVGLRATVRVRQICLISLSSSSLQRGKMFSSP